MKREENQTWLICAGQAGKPTWQGVAVVKTIDQEPG
jgi:hypothetical protein